MSASTLLPETDVKPVLGVNNVTGSLGSTLTGLAVMAGPIITSIQHVTFPTTAAGWLQIGLGVLALFARG